MTFDEFFSWLFEKIELVLIWFGDLFWFLFDGAANAFLYAVTYAGQALSDAKNYAYNLVLEIVSDVLSLYYWLKDLVETWISNLYLYIADVYNSLLAWVSSTVGMLIDFILTIRDEIYRYIAALWQIIQDWVVSRIQIAVDWVMQTFTWILVLRSFLTTLSRVFSAAVISNLVSLATTWFVALVAFIRSPEIWLYDLLQRSVLTFLDYVLAWAMGTTKYNLPVNPPWRR